MPLKVCCDNSMTNTKTRRTVNTNEVDATSFGKRIKK